MVQINSHLQRDCVLKFHVFPFIFIFLLRVGVKSFTVKSSVVRGNENRSEIGQGLRPRKVSEKSGERNFLKKKVPFEVLIKGKSRGDKAAATDGNLASCLTSAFTPDLLKQTPEATRQSVGVQVGQANLEHEDFSQSLADQCKNEREKVESLLFQLSRRNRDFEAILIALQVYSKKVCTCIFSSISKEVRQLVWA